jgi:HK97 family phage prohead protease
MSLLQAPAGAERRAIASRVELRTDSKGTVFAEGYAAKFNKWSQDLGGFRETIKPGAFNRAINEKQDVRCLMNHDPNFVLGRTKSGTLALSVDNTGLRFRCALPDTQIARDLRESMDRGDIDQCSFFFAVRDDEWSEENDPEDRKNSFLARRVKDVDLFDVSCVTYPAYLDTSCQVSERTLAEARSAAHKCGKTMIMRNGVVSYVRMTDVEIADAAYYERALKGRTIGSTPYPWEKLR